MPVEQRGFILAMTLLLLSLLLLLILGGMEANGMARQISDHFKSTAVAFQAAEAGLKITELTLTGTSMVLPSTQAVVVTRVKWLTEDDDGITHYEIISEAKFHNAHVVVGSFYDWNGRQGNRVGWEFLEGEDLSKLPSVRIDPSQNTKVTLK